MTVIRRGGSLSNTDSVTVRRVTIPMETMDGDTGIITITYQQTDTGASALSIPGWTRIGERAIGDYRNAVYYKVLTTADRSTEVEVTFGTAQRAPMVLEVWGGLQGAPVSDWNTHTSAVTTHPVDTVGASGYYMPVAIFATRAGTPPTTATPPDGYTIRQWGVQAGSWSGVAGIATANPGGPSIGGGSFKTSAAFTSITWSIGFPLKPEVRSLKAHNLMVRAQVPDLEHLRVHKATVRSSINTYMLRRGDQWVPLKTYVRRSGTWL